jgi:hypothetical protein
VWNLPFTLRNVGRSSVFDKKKKGLLMEILDQGKKKATENNYTIKSPIICALHLITGSKLESGTSRKQNGNAGYSTAIFVSTIKRVPFLRNCRFCVHYRYSVLFCLHLLITKMNIGQNLCNIGIVWISKWYLKASSLRTLKLWDRGFEYHSRHGCLSVRLFCVNVVLCVGSGLAMGWSLVQGVLPYV